MSSNRNVLVSGIIAVLIAAAVIAAAVGSGVLISRTTGPSSTQSPLQSGVGTLAVMLTDPPTVPSGVTAVYITYSDVQAHFNNAGNESGWYDLNSSGQIDLMSIINVTQTIASANVSSGTFDMLRFNITSAVVTFQGSNYTADLVYQEHMLTVRVPSGITVSKGQVSAALIDLTPTVLLLGSPTNATFAFIPAAHAYMMPAQSVSAKSLHHIGEKNDLKGMMWWQEIVQQSHFEITAASVSANSLSITVTNTGNASLLFRMAVLSSTSSVSGGWMPAHLPAMAAVSEFFVIEPNTTLAPITAYSRSRIGQMIATGGYYLPPHATVTFTYSNAISIGILHPPRMQPNTQQISPGQTYVITVLGSNLIAQTVATAQ